MYERYNHNSLIPFVDNFLSVFKSAYCHTYSPNPGLIRLIENWKQALDKNKIAGAVFMDLSNGFDCTRHELLIAKMHAYDFDLNSLIFFYSHLKNRNHVLKILFIS